MKSTLATALVLAGASIVLLDRQKAFAVEAAFAPSGYFTLTAAGSSDNPMSLPLARPAVYSGAVNSENIAETSFSVLGTSWEEGQFQYRDAQQANPQPQTYYVEFTSGALNGLHFKIANSATDRLTLDTGGDSLNQTHSFQGNPEGALVGGDTFVIRPYWRIRDVFEVNGVPVIDSRPHSFISKDDILITDNNYVGINKASTTIIYHTTQIGGPVNGPGWRAAAQSSVDFGDYILPPNHCFKIRRRNPATLSIKLPGVILSNKSITFIPGGDGVNANDTYIGVTHPAPVSLNESGLRIANQTQSPILDSISAGYRKDEVLAFATPAGYNQAPVATYYYLPGSKWRQVSNPIIDLGASVLLEPGKAFIVRKTAASPGVYWVNQPSY